MVPMLIIHSCSYSHNKQWLFAAVTRQQ